MKPYQQFFVLANHLLMSLLLEGESILCAELQKKTLSKLFKDDIQIN